MTHTSGLIYGSRGTTAVHKLYPAGNIPNDFTGPEFVATLSKLPLIAQPGSTWDYGFGLDVTGQMVESVTKQTLGGYLSDTGFQVPADKVARYAHALPNDPETGKPRTLSDLTKPVKFESGGGGAVSTASDYLKFASMLMNGGEYGGYRVLSRKMTQYMLYADQSTRTAGSQPDRERGSDPSGLWVRAGTGGADDAGGGAVDGLRWGFLLAGGEWHELVGGLGGEAGGGVHGTLPWRGAVVLPVSDQYAGVSGDGAVGAAAFRMPGAGGVSGGPAKHWAMFIQLRAGSPVTFNAVSPTLRVWVTT